VGEYFERMEFKKIYGHGRYELLRWEGTAEDTVSGR